MLKTPKIIYLCMMLYAVCANADEKQIQKVNVIDIVSSRSSELLFCYKANKDDFFKNDSLLKNVGSKNSLDVSAIIKISKNHIIYELLEKIAPSLYDRLQNNGALSKEVSKIRLKQASLIVEGELAYWHLVFYYDATFGTHVISTASFLNGKSVSLVKVREER